jgi:rod shape determining protein RodA
METVRRMDMVILLCILFLAGLGLLTLYAAVHLGDITLWQKQAAYWLLGGLVFVGLCFVPLRFVALASIPMYLVALLLLLSVPIIGTVQMGARRWLDLGLFNFQPSELMKWALLLLLAFWFASREARDLKSVLIPALATLLPALFIAMQPDLGSTLLLLTAASIMIIAAGLPWRWLACLLIVVFASLPILWNNLHDYQQQRVLAFLNPQSDPLGAGYHVIQSTIAIGSGGVFGKGYLQGTQDRLHFLPEQHTDFIFAVLAEEGGLLAAGLLLLIYGILISRILIIAARASTRFGAMLCVGIVSIFILYVVVNIGMVSGLLPVVGLPLPFISYGGSALITMLAAMGLVMRVAIEAHGKIPWQRPGNPLA